MFPVVIVQLVKGTTPSWTNYLTSNNWWKFNSVSIKYSIGYIVYALMVIGFAYFYTSITFNPIEVADNMKRSGGQIPGIRTGKPTEDFLSNMLKYVIFIGAIGLLIVATLPIAFGGIFNADVSFGGTSLIIVVGVVLETIKNIEAKMVVRNYKGFLTN
jgi:preprotein translocase subunit SecY